MKKNVGTNDVATRIIIALIFLALWGFKVISGVFAGVLLVIGVVFVLTAITDFCPLYSILGINTCRKEKG